MHKLEVLQDFEKNYATSPNLAGDLKEAFYGIKLDDTDDPPPSKALIQTALNAIKTAKKPVMIHCAAGLGRTGMVAAAYRLTKQGVPFDETIQDAVHYGFYPEERPNQTNVLGQFVGNVE